MAVPVGVPEVFGDSAEPEDQDNEEPGQDEVSEAEVQDHVTAGLREP